MYLSKRVYSISDYIIPDERSGILDENKIYTWLIDGEEAKGTIWDFIEEFGKCNWYEFRCKVCGEVKMKTGRPLLESKFLCCSDCGKFAVKDINLSLRCLHPKIADVYDKSGNSISSEYISPNSNKVVNYTCDLGHTFNRTLYSIVQSISNDRKICPICSGHRVSVGFNDLQTAYPDVVDIWDYDKNSIKPSEVSRGTEKKYWFRCKNGHSYQTSPCELRRDLRDGIKSMRCPYCKGYKVQVGYNDFKSCFPEIAELWDYSKNTITPESISKGAKGEYWFICPEGHSFSSSLDHIKRAFKLGSKYFGCNVCTGFHPEEGKSLIELKPDLVNEYWDYDVNDGTISPLLVGVYSNRVAYWKCRECGNTYPQQIDSRVRCYGYCGDCYSKLYGSSYAEQDIYKWVSQYVDCINGYKLPNGLELDIFIHSKLIGIEYNGVFWHSEGGNPDKTRHLRKYEECLKNGIQLYVIWEDDYKSKPQIIERHLKRLLGISDEEKVNARECIISDKLNTLECIEFLYNNHIQGSTRVGSYVGLELRGILVALVCYTVEGGYINLRRYATSRNVRGGFTKLISYFKNKGYKGIVTYSDNEVSEGNLYRSSGFELVEELPSDYKCLYKGKRYHKFNFRKSVFKKNPNLIYKEGASESELYSLNGILRLWDYGKKKWVLYF